MSGGQRAFIFSLGFLILLFPVAVVCGTLAGGDEYDSNYSSGEPSLAEYWNRAACYDLFDRVEQARRMGATNEEMTESFYRAEGAVKRYGPAEVFDHCNRRYKSEWEAR